MWVGDPVPMLNQLGLPDLSFGRTGVWGVADTQMINPMSSSLTLEIPNQADATKIKYVWMQITYFLLNTSYVNVLSDTVLYTDDVNSDVAVLSETSRDVLGQPYWCYYEVLWAVMPQPGHETISVAITVPAGALFAMDEVAVDTICVPEPLTVGLMVLGGVLIRRRSKSQASCAGNSKP